MAARLARQPVVSEPTPEPPIFAPAVIGASTPPSEPRRRRSRRGHKTTESAGMIEMEIGGVAVRISRGADAETVAAVMRSRSEVRRMTPSCTFAPRRTLLQERRRKIDAREEELAQADIKAGNLAGRVVAHQLGQLLDPRAILLDDGLSNSGFLRHYGARTRPGTLFKCASSAGGWGPGAAFGAKLSQPERDVFLGTGDGYFMFGSPSSSLGIFSSSRFSASVGNSPYWSPILRFPCPTMASTMSEESACRRESVLRR